MEDYLIDFKNMGWESPAPGVRYKTYIRNYHKIRLVEFTEEFIEEDWCTNGYTGYIMEGGISIDFNGTIVSYLGMDFAGKILAKAYERGEIGENCGELERVYEFGRSL